MLPSLLALLLDCAKKPDQAVASISCGALVHLIKVGGHQFNDKDWDTLLKSIRYELHVLCPCINSYLGLLFVWAIYNFQLE